MAAKKRHSRVKKKRRSLGGWVRYLLRRVLVIAVSITVIVVVWFRYFDPPTTHTIWSAAQEGQSVVQDWVPIEDIAPVMARSVVAAEDANFCLHWGFDMDAIRAAIADGGARGASTITQQVVKNVYLWQGRSWVRKGIEAVLTPTVEALWTKDRILEVYLNVAEFDSGVFGVEAAAWRYFGKSAGDLTAREAALLAAVLPNPKERNAAEPSSFVSTRATSIADGAATIARDGRAACFQDDGAS